VKLKKHLKLYNVIEDSKGVRMKSFVERGWREKYLQGVGTEY
jgi:hypothetical protein